MNAPLRDEALRIGAVVGVLGYYALAVLLILRDRSSAGPSAESAESDPSAAEPRPIQDLLFGVCLAAMIAAFPWSYARGLHWWLIGGGFLAAACFLPAGRSYRLGLRAPVPATRAEYAILGALCLGMLGLSLIRWREVPPSLGEDEARFILNGLRIWRVGDHPFHIDEAILPGLSDTLHGFFITLIGDQRLGLRAYTMLCAVLAIPVLYRCICLMGRRSAALTCVLLLMAMPFFNYYARVPPGDDLVLAQALFLYGVTRCLAAGGGLGVLIGGIALGLAQWNYHPSRLLVLFLLLLPVAALPYRKQLARGWLLRLIALGLVALPITVSLRAARGYDPSTWTWYMTPAVLSLRDLSSAWLTNLSEWKLRLSLHLAMWFSPRANMAWVLTVPGSPVAPFPIGALALLGLGILLRQIRSVVAPLVGLMFVCGLAPSLLASATPSGHRAILAEVPFVVFAALALRCLWPATRDAWRTVPGKLKAMLGAALTAWVFVAGLRYFHVEIWKDPRALHEAHNIEQSMRAERVLRDAPRYDVRGSAPFGSEHLYFEGKVPFGPFGFAYWLPPNWAERPLSVQAVASELPLLGLVKSAFPAGSWEAPSDALGFPAGWGYHTDGLKIGEDEALGQWRATDRVSGSAMFPFPGRLDVTCAGARLIYSTPLGSQSVDGQGSIQVLGGLGQVAIERAGPGITNPPVVRVRYSPEQGQTEDHTLSASDLYRMPVRGWLKSALDMGAAGGPSAAPVSTTIVPSIFTFSDIADAPLPANHARTRIYSARVRLPAGQHALRVLSDPPCPLRVTLGSDVIEPTALPRAGVELTLDGSADNGKHIEIHQLVQANGTHLRLLALGSESEAVPPYDWFEPDAPSVPVPVDLDPGRQVRIGELTPTHVVFGYMPPRVDATWQGAPIRMHGVTYAYGLGTHAWSRSTYAVPAGAVEFHAIVGLSDGAREAGKPDVTFEVWDGSGAPLFASGPIDRDSPPVRVRVDVRNTKAVTLVVTTGSGGGDWDHANWADAAFLLEPR